MTSSKPRFSLGRVVATPDASSALESARQAASELLGRHVCGDWGEVCAEDAEANEQAIHHGERLLSAYRTTEGTKLWVITEADRSATTILLPEEY
jgi:hypothetical protein